jgi:4'-phosphopantetheinyl transferase
MTQVSDLWTLPPQDLNLLSNQVHIWRIYLDQSPTVLKLLEAILSEDEVQRADRFYFDTDRNRFVVARGCLRNILGRYLKVDPDGLKFRYTKYGKPDLIDRMNPDRLRFNVSHSQELALIAVTVNQDVGVDIEYIRDDLADDQIARRYFSKDESSAYLSLPESMRTETFFAIWTRKESYIKARGEGLSLPLNQFDVSIMPEAQEVELTTRPDPEEAFQWIIKAIYPGEGYMAAVTVKAHKLQLKYWKWMDDMVK